MKSPKSIVALIVLSLLATGVSFAGDANKDKAKDKAPDKACEKMACCKPAKDGKVACAKGDKSCCCDTGEKAKDAKKEEKKS
jgi:hypothetical protein